MARAEWCADVAGRLRHGRSVVVTGPAGIGKTRALRDVGEALADQGVAVLRAVASPVAGRIPLGAIAPLLPIEVVSLPASAARIAAVSAWFAALHGPVALVIDEAEHLDDESTVVVHHLVAGDDVAVLAAVRSHDASARPPVQLERLVRDGQMDTAWLPPLDEHEVGSALAHRLDGVVAAATTRVLHAASEGNPLQLDELVRHNLAAGRITHRAGVWVGTDLEPTTTVVELLRVRLAAVAPATLRALRLVAFAGPLHEAVLVALAGADAVSDARARELLVSARPGVLAAGHPMVAEIVVASCATGDQEELLQAAVDAVLATPDAGSEWAVPLASWVLALADRGVVEPDRLVRVATRMVANLRPDLGERLALAAASAGDERARALVARTRAMQGREADEPDVSATEAFEAAVGSLEAFILGFVDGATCRAAFDRAMTVAAGGDRDELLVLDAAFSMYSGRSADSAIEQLTAAVHAHDGEQLACIAGANAIVGLTEVGRFHAALAVGEVMARSGAGDNAYHAVQMSFSTAESLHRLGRRADALALADERLVHGPGATSPMAAMFGAALVAQVAMADGRPDLAAPQLGTMIAAMGGLDAAGIGSWAERGLRLCRVWSGDRAAADGRLAPVPAHGVFQECVCRLLEVQTTLAAGQRRLAHTAALDLAHDAATLGHWYAALRAAHLACTVAPTRALADWTADLAARCDGELAAALGQHAGWLARADGAGLDKAGHAFLALGHASLALDAFRRAADELRRAGSPAAARRSAASADELEAAGALPLAPSGRLAAAHSLTPRELEVAELAAAGLSNRDIATRIGLSARTVETHLQRAYTKLGVHDRAELGVLGLGTT